ncbi:hypothetical protein CLOM_g18261 [Closterium sp. NIES-68]|nr:hypothetical protein CLOM_g18261 [Closterium sp. NIES-68]GJP63414.1 hypothetical protein CLOP_g20499 [Closterium sp. NIES-67]
MKATIDPVVPKGSSTTIDPKANIATNDLSFRSSKLVAVAAAVLVAVAAIAAAFVSIPGGLGTKDVNFALQPTRNDQEFRHVEGAGPGIGASGIVFYVDRLQEQIDHLATFSNDEPPAVTRVLFTENDVKARDYVESLMRESGLIVRKDAIGNIFGRWEGSNESLPAVMTGSHTDAIPLAGKFDGVVGVLGAIAAVQALKSAGFSPHRPIEVLMFTSEEPTRFGIGCLGSRMLANQTGYVDRLLALQDKDGQPFAEAAAQAGFGEARDAGSVAAVALGREQVGAFVELHIEQGPILEEKGEDIGIVTAIAAPATLMVDFSGGGGHAGALLMKHRNDAGLAAAELALAVEAAVLATKADDTVGTTGHLVLQPNAVNSVPRHAHMEIDIRDIDEARRDGVVSTVMGAARRIAARRGVKLERMELVNADPPARCSSMVTSAISSAVDELGLSHRRMVSRAYHDALFMARVAPTGMIFIPCRGGVSHRPDEFTSKANLANGVRVLALTLAKLSLQ